MHGFLNTRSDIFAVVSEVDGEGYRLSVYSDDTVPPFGPSLPCPAVFNDPQLFREFLLVSLAGELWRTAKEATFV